jgi:hypothetical protein
MLQRSLKQIQHDFLLLLLNKLLAVELEAQSLHDEERDETYYEEETKLE